MKKKEAKSIESVRDAALFRALNTPHKPHKPLKAKKKATTKRKG